ncbi:MAG: amidohydrolase family protein [SAR202 cluster bacterium]|nr:amidohydrolase family protein [SAR202 cluster bacterium]
MPNRKLTLIKASRMFDGSGKATVRNAALLIEDGQISKVGSSSDLRAPEGADVQTVDYGNATILPGLVDAHTHMCAPGDGTPGDEVAREQDDMLLLQAASNARTVLHSGVTTARENGAKHAVGFSLRDGIKRGLAAGPRMVVCGRPIAITGGHMGYFGSEADGEDGVRKEVRKLLKEGADYIKIAATGGSTRTSDPNRASYTVAELRVMTDEAHRAARLTAAHCTSAQGVQNCLDAEVDMIIHCIFVDPDGKYRFRPDLVERLVQAGAWVNPTLYVQRARIDRLLRKREINGKLTPQETREMETIKRTSDVRIEAVGKMAGAGVRMVAGSDSPWGWYAPGEFVNEILALADAGLSNRDALMSATSGAAESIGVGREAGRLEPGRQADVLVVGGDPLRDLKTLWDVRDVYQAGRQIQRGVK